MRLLTLALPVIAAAGLSACAAGGADAPQSYASTADQCFYNSDVRSFTDGAPNVVLVNLGAVAIAVVFSLLPAYRAARLHPVRALRFE